MSAPLSQVSEGRKIPLKKWLWNSYVGAALIPLLLVELSFLGIYWGTGEFVYTRGAEAVTGLSKSLLSDAVVRESTAIGNRLQTIATMADVYADETKRALETPAEVSEAEIARHSYTPEGTFYTTSDTGGSAVFYSGVLPVGEAERDKVWRTVRLDPIMKSIKEADPLIAQIYLNTFDSLNRIYPYFDVLEIYPPKMDIPSYNFYYEADPVHNPEGKVVWTDAYIDPAGSGWMVSAIAPVMGDEKLEAVVGIDVTIDRILKGILDIQLEGDGYALLVGRDGTILALPPQGEEDLMLSELIEHSYSEAILQDTFKPAEFNLFRRDDLSTLALEIQNSASGVTELDLGQPVLAAWAQVPGAQWHLIGIASEASLLGQTNALRSQLTLVSQLMLAALVLFYAVFFAVLWRRSVSMSEQVAQPLAEIESAMALISEGNTVPRLKPHMVIEVQRLRDHLAAMSDRLSLAAKAKSSFLSAMSHELRTPLNIIIGYSEILKRSAGKPIDSERVAQIDNITTAGKDLLSIVDGVMELARLEQGFIQKSATATRIGPIIQAAVASVRPMADQRKQHIDLALNEPLPLVRTDSEALQRIVSELLSNAVKYNSPEGQVSVRVAVLDADWLSVSITDTGVGIAADKQDRLFKAFDRLGHENSSIAGAGIGLSIVKRLCTALGCTISFSSSEGKGTTFTVRVPRAASES